jgi:hypothetical protein
MKGMVQRGLLVVVALGLAACGAGGAEGEGPTAGSTSAPAASGDAVTSGVTLTDEMRLMLGTMKLDEVGLEPDATQAAELLVLWQAYRSLVTSDTAAPQEIEAVLGQIEKGMTAEQTAAIAAMELDQEDLSAFLESFRQDASDGDDFSFDGVPGGGPGGPAGGAAGGFAPPGGGAGGDFIPPDGGAGPASGGFGGSDSGLNPEMQATAQAGRSAGGGAQGGLFLLRPLIAELQALAASE